MVDEGKGQTSKFCSGGDVAARLTAPQIALTVILLPLAHPWTHPTPALLTVFSLASQ
jgi:hypothetical protein